MKEMAFNDTEIAELKHARHHHPKIKVRRRLQALYLKSQGFAHKDITVVCGIASRATLGKWFTLYEQGGIEALECNNYRGQPSALNAYSKKMKAYFESHPPRSVKEAKAAIEAQTGLIRSETQVRAFMKRLGMRLLKLGCAPGKVMSYENHEEQQAFHADELQPRLEEVKKKKGIFTL